MTIPRPPRAFAGLLSLAALAAAAHAGPRADLNFDPDWKFTKADPAGAGAPGFDDSGWTAVSAPHTYNDVDTFDHFSVPGHRGEQGQWGGVTWYRKTFGAPEATMGGRRVFIEFEAVRQVAAVYLNGRLLGVCKTGFTPFGFDLTPFLRIGGSNVLAVQVDNRFMKDPMGGDAPAVGERPAGNPNLALISAQVNESIPEELDKLRADQIPWNNPHWHPAHGGIFRNVRLHVTDPLHISLPLYSFLQTAGPYVYATDIHDDSAQVTVEVPVENMRDADAAGVEARAEVFDADGRSALVLKALRREPLTSGERAKFVLSGRLPSPRFWEPDYPHVYRVAITLSAGGRDVDATEAPLGIRVVHWDARTGFFINGHHVKLHGWGQKPTDEWPGLGAAQPDWMHQYTLGLMKEAGGNFVRWGHCATGPAMIDAGDRLGIAADMPGVDGESDTRGAAWKLRVMAFRDTLIYFRNHPSILIWEGGNQKVTSAHAHELRALFDLYDPHGGRAYAHRRADEATAAVMDVQIGTEGGREISRLPVVEGEYDREESPRRVWDNASPPNFGYPEARGQTYDLTSEQYAVNQVSQWMGKLSAGNHSGGANWIFSDSTSGGRVSVEVARAGGEVDGVRLPKEAYYVCSVLFRADPQVHIIGHWTYPAGTVKTVYVAANAESVELLVNGRPLGRALPKSGCLFTFPKVAWEPGEIKAVAYAKGAVVATDARHTAGAPVALRLTPLAAPGGLRADGSDVALIDVEAVDANGERCPTFQQRVDFTCEGPCTWRGGYNSGKINSINNPWLDLECGVNRVSVRAGRLAGKIAVTARCAGLQPGSVEIESKAFAVADGSATTMPVAVSFPLPAAAPAHQIGNKPIPLASAATAAVMAGRFTRTLNYTGPQSAIVHVETGAQDGKNAYVDVDSPFAGLPPALAGADWVQAALRDSLYSAVDFIEIAVPAGRTVYVAHDDQLARPAWLTGRFKPTKMKLTLEGRPMTVFSRHVAEDESLTLGSNTEDRSAKDANMYLVFVNAAP